MLHAGAFSLVCPIRAPESTAHRFEMFASCSKIDCSAATIDASCERLLAGAAAAVDVATWMMTESDALLPPAPATEYVTVYVCPRRQSLTGPDLNMPLRVSAERANIVSPPSHLSGESTVYLLEADRALVELHAYVMESPGRTVSSSLSLTDKKAVGVVEVTIVACAVKLMPLQVIIYVAFAVKGPTPVVPVAPYVP